MKICNKFLAQLYELIFNKECPRFLDEALKILKTVEEFYIEKDTNYIRIYRTMKSPNNLPKHDPYRIVLSEVE
jgi:hypothetical protein